MLPGLLKRLLSALLIIALCGISSSCSISKIAVNRLGDALASDGGAFASDNDPELIREAAPFSLKLMESLLAKSPMHEGLLLATASGFTQYAYAFVQQEAEEREASDLTAANSGKERAKKLFIRARDYGLRGLETRIPRFREQLAANPQAAVALAKKTDVALLYWTAASWGAAISIAKDDPVLIADLPKMEALIDRALALDSTFGAGAIHAFLISYEPARTNTPGDALTRSTKHFEQAVALSNGAQAAPFVAMAETVAVARQDAPQFRQLLERALAIDVDAHPDLRLANLIAQRRARWLLSRIDELFLNP